MLYTYVMKQSYRRWRLADTPAPCSCADAVEYSRTLPRRTRRKTRPCLAMHPPDANIPFCVYRRRHLADTPAPCSCADAIGYSCTLPRRTRRKTRPYLAVHPPDANLYTFCVYFLCTAGYHPYSGPASRYIPSGANSISGRPMRRKSLTRTAPLPVRYCRNSCW